MKPIGWRNESHRHYLASRGVKTNVQNFFAFKVEADRAREIEQKKEAYEKKLAQLEVDVEIAKTILANAKKEKYPEYLIKEYEGVLAKAEQKQKEFEQRDWRTYMAKKDDEKKIVVWTEPYISQEPEGVAEVDFNERQEVVNNAQEARVVKKFIEDVNYKDANLSGESPRIVSFDEGERLRKLREDKKIKEFVHDKEFWKSFIDKEEDFHRGESSDSQYSPRHLLQFARDHDWGKNAKLSSDGKRIEGLTEQGTINGKPYFEKGKSVPAKMSELKRYGGY